MSRNVRRNRWVLSSLVFAVVLTPFLSVAVLAVDRDKAMYVRGTLSAIKKRAEGSFNAQPETELAFRAGKKGSVAIPYARKGDHVPGHGDVSTIQDAERV